MKIPILLTSLCCLLGGIASAELPRDLPPGGLAVMAGSDAAANAMALARNGRWLVRVISPNEAQAGKDALATAGLHPLVTVSTGFDRLPFATDSVNAVVVGTGATITAAEIHRVLAPGGILLSDQAGAWKREVEPADPRYAPWTDFRADSHGTGVSADTAVAPSTSLRWLHQSFVGQEVRSHSGVVAYGAKVGGYFNNERRKEFVDTGLHGLDAFSGVPLWSTPNLPDFMGRTMFVAHPLGFIHPQAGEDKPVVLTDARTGAIRVTYDKGLTMLVPYGDPGQRLGPAERKDGKGGSNGVLLVHGDTLVQIYGYDVAVLDVPTGNLKWKARLQEPGTLGIISRDGKKLYLTESDNARTSFGRWGSFRTVAMTAFDLASGKQLWRNGDWATSETLVDGKKLQQPTNLSELIDADGRLYAFDHSSNIASDNHADLYEIDPATGARKWEFPDANFKDPNQPEYGKHGPMTNNLVFWDDKLVNKVSFYEMDGPTKKQSGPSFLGGNTRCVRLSGSANFLIQGFTAYYGRDGRNFVTFMTRGNCSLPNYATYGAVMSVTDETCNCYNGMRGNAGLIPWVEPEAMPERARLTKAPMALPAVTPAVLPADSPIVASWVPYISLRMFRDYDALGPVDAGPVQLTVDVQRRQVRATANGAARWTWQADGRVHTLPTVHEGRAYVTTTSGTITCLDLATGKPYWSFLAALNRDQVVVNGQLESRWPVHGTVIHDGALYAVAGRHIELDGGLMLWALDPASGAVRQRARLYQPLSVAEPGKGHREAGLSWRGDRDIASKTIQPGGVALDDQGRVCLINRFWGNAARAKITGMWGNLASRTKNRNDDNVPDFENPMQQLIPIDLAAWDGKTLDLRQVAPPPAKKK
jgi:outer membrane protein assembly factor BamB/SAM-dependent methyltransferase